MRSVLLLALTLSLTACSSLGGKSGTNLTSADLRLKSSNQAEESADNLYAAEGGYAGGGLTYFDIEGEFDGDVIIVGDTDTTIVPDIDFDPGYRFWLGYRGQKYAFEIAVEQITHDGEFLGAGGDDVFNAFDVNFKQFYRRDTRVQPYFMLGMGYLWADIEDGSSNGVTVAHADMTGVSLNTGIGVSYFLSEHLAIDVAGVYRFAEFLDVDGISESRRIEGKLDGDSYGITAGLSWTF